MNTKIVPASELKDDLRPGTYLNPEDPREELQPDDIRILVVMQNYWGMGKTLNEAVVNARKAGASTRYRRYVAYLAHKDTYVDGMGYIIYPKAFPVREIHRVGQFKK